LTSARYHAAAIDEFSSVYYNGDILSALRSQQNFWQAIRNQGHQIQQKPMQEIAMAVGRIKPYNF